MVRIKMIERLYYLMSWEIEEYIWWFGGVRVIDGLFMYDVYIIKLLKK